MSTLSEIVSKSKAAVEAYEVAQKTGGVVTVNILVEAPKEKEVAEEAFASIKDFPEVVGSDFEQFAVRVIGELTLASCSLVAGAIGYAFSEVLHGPELSQPDVIHLRDPSTGHRATELCFEYDTTKVRSSDPDFALAFQRAEQYIQDGSPVRKTDRSGPGTKGTRLVNGIGSCDTEFFILTSNPEEKKPDFPFVSDIGVAVGDKLRFDNRLLFQPAPIFDEVIDVNEKTQSVGTKEHFRFSFDYFKLRDARVVEKGPGKRYPVRR